MRKGIIYLIIIGGIVVLLYYLVELYRYYAVKKRLSKRLQKLDSKIQNIKVQKPFNIHNYFPYIRAIVLPSRKEHFILAMKSHGIKENDYKIIKAIPKENLDISKLVQNGTLVLPFHPGKVACHLSHLKALQDFLSESKNKDDICLILEDDIQQTFNRKMFKRRILALFQEIIDLKKKGEKWDILYIGKCHDKCSKYKFLTPQIATNTFALCRHAYITTRKGAEIIVKNSIPMFDNGDRMLREMSQEGLLKALVVHPAIFYQNRKALGSHLDNNSELDECNGLYYGDFGTNPWYKITVMITGKNGSNIREKYQKYNTINNIIEVKDLTSISKAISKAENRAIFCQPSNIFLSEETLNSLANSLVEEPNKIHQIFGIKGAFMATKEALKHFRKDREIKVHNLEYNSFSKDEFVVPLNFSSPTLVCVCYAGLCNRLRLMRTGYALAQESGRNFAFIWVPNSRLNAPFQDLFRYPPHDFEVHELNQKFIPGEGPFFQDYKKDNLQIIRKEVFSFSPIVTVVSSRILPSNYPINSEEWYSRNIIPQPDIWDNIITFIQKNSMNMANFVGVHIRRTDHSVSRKIPISKYINRVRSLSSSINIFLCSDDEDAISQFITKIGPYYRVYFYPHVSRERNNVEGIKGAIIDLWILSMCPYIIYSGSSSFSREAHYIGGSKLISLEKNSGEMSP